MHYGLKARTIFTFQATLARENNFQATNFKVGPRVLGYIISVSMSHHVHMSPYWTSTGYDNTFLKITLNLLIIFAYFCSTMRNSK